MTMTTDELLDRVALARRLAAFECQHGPHIDSMPVQPPPPRLVRAVIITDGVVTPHDYDCYSDAPCRQCRARAAELKRFFRGESK